MRPLPPDPKTNRKTCKCGDHVRDVHSDYCQICYNILCRKYDKIQSDIDKLINKPCLTRLNL